jgi:hypothetical protein
MADDDKARELAEDALKKTVEAKSDTAGPPTGISAMNAVCPACAR